MSAANRQIQVVVGYDFSPSAEQALLRAVDVACRAPQHTLQVIAAIDPRDGLAVRPAKEIDWEYAPEQHAKAGSQSHKNDNKK